ncbi:MAG: SMP-30/gluconolactonase/LRE family protein, partial [Candidatus Sericytochromatia bacterium]
MRGVWLTGVLALLGCGTAAVPDGGGGGPRSPLPASPSIEAVASGFQFLEGPAHDTRGFLLFCDTTGDAIHRRDDATGTLSVHRRPAGQPNGLAIDRAGAVYAAERGARRLTREAPDGTLTVLADRYQGKRLNGPNDLVIKSDGAVYFTDPPFGLPGMTEGKELDFSGVFRWTEAGGLELLSREMTLPNGIQFSPDERRLYVNESRERRVYVFDVTASGTLANRRPFAELAGATPDWSADGLEVDEEGNVYAAGPKGVWAFAPDGDAWGRLTFSEHVTNLAFGDRDRR